MAQVQETLTRKKTKMSDELFSFVYDGRVALEVFPRTTPRNLLLALLATITPENSWEGCVVFKGDTPLEPHTICVGTKGPGADQVQRKLVEALEAREVTVLEVYEGGPEEQERIAMASGGKWS